MDAHVLIVDRDDALRTALADALTAAGYTVAVAAGSAEALRLAGAQPPAVAVVNLLLADGAGLDTCRRLWAANPNLPIIPLLERDAAVPDDFLVKPVAGDVLLARIDRYLRRRSPAAPAALQFADLRLDTATREAWRGQRPITLTTTEFELLFRFLQRPRQVLTRDFLYEHVWGHDFAGESKVLDVYVHYLRQKLEAGGEARLIHTVRGAGYVLREEA